MFGSVGDPVVPAGSGVDRCLRDGFGQPSAYIFCEQVQQEMIIHDQGHGNRLSLELGGEVGIVRNQLGNGSVVVTAVDPIP